jgi:hypothetical protein
MKKILLAALLGLPLFLTSCSTPTPPQAYHATDSTALVIDSQDGRTSRIVQPILSQPVRNDKILTAAKVLPQRQTAVVILENYTEAQIGEQFRDRGTPWFIGLRCLGYEHIVFLQGNGQGNPEGLTELAKYD